MATATATKKVTKNKQAKAKPSEGRSPVATFAFKSTLKANNGTPANVPISDIVIEKGFNPRTIFDADAISHLAASIRKSGLIYPIVVRPAKSGKFAIVDGERRFRAVTELKWGDVPAIIRSDLADDDIEATFAAMITGNDESSAKLSPLELATAVDRLKKADKSLTNEVIAARSGITVRTIRRYASLVDLPEDVVERLKNGTISANVAMELASQEDAVRKEILSKEADDSLTPISIRKRAKEIATAAVDRVEGRTSRPTDDREPAPRSLSVVTPRSRKVLSDAISQSAVILHDARVTREKEIKDKTWTKSNETTFTGVLSSTYALLYAFGEFGEGDYLPPIEGVNDDDISKRLAPFWRLVEKRAAAQKAADASEEKGDPDDNE
jgi:ParB/RepB/Spo0J family partition protein